MLDKGTTRPVSPLRRLVTARQARAEKEAGDVVAASRRTAAAMLRAARRRCRTLSSRFEAAAEARAQARWASNALATAELLSGDAAAREAEIVDLALSIVRRILGRAYELDPAFLQSTIERVCAPLRASARVRLAVAPECAPAVASLCTARDLPVNLEVDESLAPGDCVAECGGVRVDARLDSIIAGVRRHLLSDEGAPS
jgi:type III secretion protein L